MVSILNKLDPSRVRLVSEVTSEVNRLKNLGGGLMLVVVPPEEVDPFQMTLTFAPTRGIREKADRDESVRGIIEMAMRIAMDRATGNPDTPTNQEAPSGE